MDIAGVLVRSLPADMPKVSQALTRIPGLEIHLATEDGRLVVTLDESGGERLGDTISDLNRIDGVISAAMVYQYSE